MSTSDRPLRACILREAAIGAPIAIAFSAAFMMALFGGRAQIAVWGRGGLAADTLPHTLGVLVPTVVVQTLVIRKRQRSGLPILANAPAWMPRRLALRVLILSLGGLVLGGGVLHLTYRFCPDPLPFATALAIKLGFGAALAIATTPFTVMAALADPVPPRKKRDPR